MSKSQSRGDLQFFLPREGSAVLLPKEDSSKTTETKTTKTKTIDLHIEDFLEKLNDAVQRQVVLVGEDFLQSPVFLIGDQEVYVGLAFEEDNSILVEVYLYEDSGAYYSVRSILLTGHVGNLTFEERGGAAVKKCGSLNVVLGSMEEVEEAMTTSDNHRFDLQVILTTSVTKGSNNDHWIIPR